MIERRTKSEQDRFAMWRSLLSETPLPATADVGVELQRLVQERLDVPVGAWTQGDSNP